jgi:cytochrome c peroxidase
MRISIAGIKIIITILFVSAGCILLFVGPALTSAQSTTPRRRVRFEPHIPFGIPVELWRKSVPAGKPLTAEKVALGEALYFDKRLSADRTVSCATCHDPATAFADRATLSTGVGGKAGTRNAPTLLNIMFSAKLFWDGRANSLEEQIRQPLVNSLEMGMQNHDAVVTRVAASPQYRQMFREVFGTTGVTIDTIAQAIAAFERTQLSGNSPFDRFIAGDADAISISQKRGWRLFREKAQCITCHSFSASLPFFTDFGFHNTGVATTNQNFKHLLRRARELSAPARPNQNHTLNSLAHSEGLAELGRYLVTQRPADIGAFKTPSLRDVELTAPYMHNGSEKTLLDVLKFYNRGGHANPHLDPDMRPLNLTDEEMNDLVEFMRALTSDDVLRQAQISKPQTRQPVP